MLVHFLDPKKERNVVRHYDVRLLRNHVIQLFHLGSENVLVDVSHVVPVAVVKPALPVAQKLSHIPFRLRFKMKCPCPVVDRHCSAKFYALKFFNRSIQNRDVPESRNFRLQKIHFCLGGESLPLRAHSVGRYPFA